MHGNLQEASSREHVLAYTNNVRGDTSLFHEIHETVRRLLQHIVFVSLLTLRLYMLPLLYISHKLATRDDPWYPASWNFILYPGRSVAECACCRNKDGGGILVETWHNLRNTLSARFRVFRTLYSLAKLIGEDPNALRPAQMPLLDETPDDAPDSAIDVQSERCASPKMFHDDPNDLNTEGPGSASQIYHTALLNGNTLDDILAAFEAEEIASRLKTVRLARPESPIPHQDQEHQEMSTEHKGHHHHNSSIQITPERMLMQQKDGQDNICQAQTNEETLQQQSQTPAQQTEDRATVVATGQENMRQNVLNYPATCSDRHDADQENDKRASLTDLKRCPTFVRRHNQSRVSKGSISGDRHSLAVLHERDAMSSPAVGLGSPTKRAKVQRRVKVYQDLERTGMS